VTADFERREPRCRICRDETVRVGVNELLDWRGVPIPREGGKTHRIMWVHFQRHYSFAGKAAYWNSRTYKEFKKALGR
jgi:hypothetical protein